METKAFPTFITKIDGEARQVTGIASVIGVIDAGNDLIHKGFFTRTIEQRSERVKHLWQHDARNPPIATITELRELGKAELPKELKAKYPDAKGGLLVGRQYLETERANEVFAGLKITPPAITEMSIAFDPVKYDYETLSADGGDILIRNLREGRLWDTSDVNWGMNEATVASIKSALPFHDTGVADATQTWSVPELKDFAGDDWEDLSEGQRQRIAEHFAAGKQPEGFKDLLLPHHAASKDGVGPAVFAGVEAAMDQLLSAGNEIHGADRKAVYDHLAKHYEQFGKEPPALKNVELAWSLGDALLKAQAVDAPEIIQSLKNLQSALRPDPSVKQDDPTLTLRLGQEALQRRLAMAIRQN